MSRDSTGLDRLLPRHPISLDVPVLWDIRRVRRLIGRGHETSEHAQLLNLSLEGALIEVPLPTERSPGDRVVIAIDERRGEVEICHARVAKSGNRMLFGVAFVNARRLTGTIHGLVATARGNDEQLLAAWNRAK